MNGLGSTAGPKLEYKWKITMSYVGQGFTGQAALAGPARGFSINDLLRAVLTPEEKSNGLFAAMQRLSKISLTKANWLRVLSDGFFGLFEPLQEH